jgi:DNA-binding winged helix-turn-helix (wHTH) protein
LLYLFDKFVLDTDIRELRSNSGIVSVEPQVFDLLAFLIRNRDRVVSRDDLLESVWAGRTVSESTLGSRMNAARAAIGDSGEAQRLIRTLPRVGFRFVGEVREDEAAPAPPRPQTSPSGEQAAASARPASAPAADKPSRGRSDRHPRWLVPGAVTAAVAVLVLVAAFRLADHRPPGASSLAQFDPAIVPMLDSDQRATLADYAQQPGHKALAISPLSMGKAVGAADVESAKTEALQRCGLRPQLVCTLYAVDMDVVWPSGIVPMLAGAEQRTEPLPDKFTPARFAPVGASWWGAAESYAAEVDHRAFAAGQRGFFWTSRKPSRDEAVRLATQGCGYGAQVPCLVVSIDGFWTVEFPTSRRPLGFFLPVSETEIPLEQRQRIGTIYQGKPWRAVARGRNETWHAVAGAPSEAAAIDAALQACAQADTECRLFAVGNWLVGEGK